MSWILNNLTSTGKNILNYNLLSFFNYKYMKKIEIPNEVLWFINEDNILLTVNNIILDFLNGILFLLHFS